MTEVNKSTTFLIMALMPWIASCAATKMARDGASDERELPVAAADAGKVIDAAFAGATGRDKADAAGLRFRAAPADAAQDPYTPPSFWSDPDYRRRFAESFIAETEVEPTVSDGERELFAEIGVVMGEDRTEDAIQILEQSRGPAASALFDYMLGNLLYQGERFEAAISAYRVAVDKHPKFKRALIMLGEGLYRTEQHAEAVEVFAKLISLGAGDSTTYGLLAVSHMRSGSYIAAESAFRLAMMMAPARSEMRMGLAESFFRQGLYQDAVALFDELLAGDPDNAQLWQWQGEAYYKLRKPLEAAKNFEIVDRLREGGAPASTLNDLAHLYAQESLFDLAVPNYLRALQEDSGLGLGRALEAARHMLRSGSHDDSITLIRGIEQLGGERVTDTVRKKLLMLRARIAVAQSDAEEEARVLEEVVAIDPLDGEALILLGQRASRTGSLAEAVSYFERAASVEGFESDAALRHGEALVRAGSYGAALQLLRRAAAAQPNREDLRRFVEQVERAAKSKGSR